MNKTLIFLCLAAAIFFSYIIFRPRPIDLSFDWQKGKKIQTVITATNNIVIETLKNPVGFSKPLNRYSEFDSAVYTISVLSQNLGTVEKDGNPLVNNELALSAKDILIAGKRIFPISLPEKKVYKNEVWISKYSSIFFNEAEIIIHSKIIEIIAKKSVKIEMSAQEMNYNFEKNGYFYSSKISGRGSAVFDITDRLYKDCNFYFDISTDIARDSEIYQKMRSNIELKMPLTQKLH